MFSMNHDERIAHIKVWFQSDITVRFNMPRDVDPKIAAMDVIEAINSNLPSPLTKEQIGTFLSSITKEVSRSAKGRTLPIPKEFVDAVRELTHSSQIATHNASDNAWRIDPLSLAIKRVRAKESICESWLKGDKRKLLLRHVNESELHLYDLYIAAHTQ
jgi:hypothetical protein